MAQHKMKKKTSVPAGVKQKVKKQKQQQGHPRKGSNVTLPAKKNTKVIEHKLSASVSKTINQKNEDMVRGRADKDQGRVSKKK
ncbi:unnamed protein product [Bursaphelenchus okinawaensis]|uniref:Uncharacterized protein n=1 Tax=Bursaphelenchus okinawaensis TaxID=465554 RepID=A0A811KHV1_9BILA|nr:unnamed protein product [Bursaphelenchus okinawaensis]CAG9103534.1 unnamed protein product [Bursaphelenchus okinawaensis]